MPAGPRDYFLDNLSRWEFDIPYSAQWVVHITPNAGVSNFLSNIRAASNIDHANFRLNPEIMQALFGASVQGWADDGLGLHFAQSIQTPQEGAGHNALSIGGGSGGFIAGLVGGERITPTQRNISIEFLETNLDFIDGIIRPWIITAAYRGLIELEPRTSIKADIDIIQYTKGDYRPIRKIHAFEGCVPVDVGANTLDYEGEKIIKRTVGWIYNHYTYELLDGVENGSPSDLLPGKDLILGGL